MKPPRIVREGAWVAGAQFGTGLLTLLGARALTTLMAPGDYGTAALALGACALVSGVFCLPLLQALLRFYPASARTGQVGSLRRLTAALLKRRVLAGGILLSLAVGGIAWRSPVPPAVLAGLAGGGLLAVEAWRNFESNLLNAARRQASFSIRSLLDSGSRPLAAIGLIALFGPSAAAMIGGFFLGTGLVGWLLRDRVVRGAADEGPADPRLRPDLLAFARPLAINAALNWVPSLGDRYILGVSAGASAVGIYSAAYALGSQPFIAMNSVFVNTLRPLLFDAVARGDRARERAILLRWTGLLALCSLAGVVGFFLLREPIVRLLLGPDYRQGAIELIPWIALAYALQSLQQTGEQVLLAHGRTRQMALLQIVAAVASLILYATLIPLYQARGAAVATAATFLLSAGLSWCFALFGGGGAGGASVSPEPPLTPSRAEP